jgi:hypothetical protein
MYLLDIQKPLYKRLVFFCSVAVYFFLVLFDFLLDASTVAATGAGGSAGLASTGAA